MVINFFKILTFLSSKEKSLFDISVNDQKAFLYTLPEPNDDLERSYNQYLCQIYFQRKFSYILYNIISLIILLLIIPFLLLKPKKSKIIECDAVANLNGNSKNVIPEELKSKFSSLQYLSVNQDRKLSYDDISFVFKIFSQHPFSYYFILKVLFKISEYNCYIRLYNPKSIITCSEYSFTSSILTAYCNKNSIIHINVMHGEKLFNIRDSFFRFNACYIWDKHYESLFLSMRAAKDQFILCIPRSLSIEKDLYLNDLYYADIKYYLAIYSEMEIKSIINSLSNKAKAGTSIKYRPHPLYSDIDLLLHFVKSEDIEFPENVSIEESVINCNYIVGSYSTALLQGYYSGKKVVIDDVSYFEIYQKLFDRNYFLLKKEHILLSKFK